MSRKSLHQEVAERQLADVREIIQRGPLADIRIGSSFAGDIPNIVTAIECARLVEDAQGRLILAIPLGRLPPTRFVELSELLQMICEGRDVRKELGIKAGKSSEHDHRRCAFLYWYVRCKWPSAPDEAAVLLAQHSQRGKMSRATVRKIAQRFRDEMFDRFELSAHRLHSQNNLRGDLGLTDNESEITVEQVARLRAYMRAKSPRKQNSEVMDGLPPRIHPRLQRTH